jgi:diaminohydroxyphosphoribosylaminopyrimidine deaminase / 5-amino-6-(5-phosphoribosylamino)uracil reductase
MNSRGEVADARYMARALELAERGWGRVSPNPLVGAVVVRDGRVVGEGWHGELGGPHAEVGALAAAGEQARGATLYVTLEPCAHHGRTPPCTEAVLAAGVRRIVIAARDPNPVARGGGDILRDAGLEVTYDVGGAEARRLNAAFFHAFESRPRPRPWVQLKLALSLDARVADGAGRSTWITGPEAREEVHRMRAGHDAIAVGIGTALADDPLLTVRGTVSPRTPPVRIVFDRRLRLPVESRLLQTLDEAPLWIVCAPDAEPARSVHLEELGVRVLHAVDLHSALGVIEGEGIRSLFCEGGARLASALLVENLADRIALFYAPLFLGGDGADPFREIPGTPIADARRWSHIRASSFGADTLILLER